MAMKRIRRRRRRRRRRSSSSSKEKRVEIKESMHILELPDVVIIDILSRLSLKTIFCCRCVCKTFQKLISDPYFAKLHLTTSPTTTTTTTTTTLLTHHYHSSSALVHLSLLDHHQTTSSSSSSYKTPFRFSTNQVGLVGSCNGIACFHKHSSFLPSYYICNPILGECMLLPPPSPPTQLDSTYLNGYGFGFSPNTNQYKVIRFVSVSTSGDPITGLSTRKTVTQVHTVGTQMWRNIGDAPSPRPARLSFDPYLNGALHWVTNSPTSSNLLYSFDIEREQFLPVPLPAHFDIADYVSKITWINVGSTGGCLCIFYVCDETQFEVWVMNDYGMKESWTKKFVINVRFYCLALLGDENRPIRFLNNGDMLLLICNNSRALLSYSPRKRSIRVIKNYGIGSRIEDIAHTPSFVSLRDVAKGKDLYVHIVKWGETFIL